MRVRRLAIWPAVSLAATLGLAACGSDGDGPGRPDPDAAVRIEIAEPQHLVPTDTAETNGSQVLSALFSPLIDYDRDNKPYEVAARSIESTDNRVWTVKLKTGYTFHNGEPVTAQNYLDAWNYGAYGPNEQNSSYFFEKIAGYDDLQGDPPAAKTLSGLRKVDDLTFTVTLAEPYAEFRTMLGYTAFYPLPKAAFTAPGVLDEGYEDAPIGQGPFRMKGSWVHDAKVEVERYDAFPGQQPKVAGVEFRIYQQATAAYADVLSDNLDVIKTIPTENLPTAPDDLGDRFRQSPASSLQLLAFPTFQQEFSKPEVRKAISMAIDRDGISDSIFKGAEQPARSFVSPVVAGYRKDTIGEAGTYDPARARAMYEAAGGPRTIELSYNGDGAHGAWVDATCDQLATNLGVTCVGTPEPKFADLLTKLGRKEPVGLFRMGWVMDYPSMENYLGPLYSSTGSSNYYGYRNERFDQLLAEGAKAPSEEEAIRKYQAAEDLLAADLPVIPLRFGRNSFGHSAKVRNVEMDLFDRVDLLKIEALR
ncbi:ABC transporter substrate-binding protein [Micromonospora sp. PLK6-60]|uniref:peptide ABC transporter substrate-binding protein n=1 Tax=Micromonospora sp. PLK6-60 TaxID=2873383 RepID=UPI001CA75E53|nr:ABC transporter substrate-binding protein [Micromonospora sp. PLK6-60]MBY8874342.1 ABC transporter substrate-binding protein [Micromonospora sp. PLK6-60]